MANEPSLFVPRSKLAKRVTHITDSQERATVSASGNQEIHSYLVEWDIIVQPGMNITATDGSTSIPLYGSMLDPTNPRQIVTDIEVQRKPESPKVFLVLVTYSNSDPAPNTTTGPEEKWELDLTVNGVPWSEAVYNDRNGIPILNSSKMRFSEQAERKNYDDEYNVSFRSWTVDVDNISACRGKINAVAILMTINGYRKLFPAGTLKLDTASYRTVAQSVSPSATTPIDPSAKAWQINYVLLYKKDGHQRKFIDQGFYTLNTAGKPVQVIDPQTAAPATEPVYLDGHGQKLSDGFAVVLLPFDIEFDADFGPLFKGLGTTSLVS